MQQFDLCARPAMTPIDVAVIARQPSFSAALNLCQTMSGLDNKAFTGAGGITKDAAQFSRVMNPGPHYFPQDKLNTFMDLAGNEAPLLWLAYSRGYALESLRLRETQVEHELRMVREQRDAARHEVAVLTKALRAGGGL